MPSGVNSKDNRSARVVKRDATCTAIFEGKLCGKDSEHAHHWYPKNHVLRENPKYMQGVCGDCHKVHEKHQKSGNLNGFPEGLLPNEPFRI